jgi:hypothetical protein
MWGVEYDDAERGNAAQSVERLVLAPFSGNACCGRLIVGPMPQKRSHASCPNVAFSRPASCRTRLKAADDKISSH